MQSKARFFTMLLALAACTAAAQQVASPPVAPAASTEVATPVDSGNAQVQATTTDQSIDGGHALTAADVNTWLDGYLPFAMRSGDIAGADVAIVKDGEILTERGYGYADVAKKTPVDPRLTLFRPGSVSKLVTWTAVMQLVEEGKIDLDTDVNKYLDFKIPPRDGKPVTMRNIMQHVGGFEEQIKDIISYNPNAPKYDEILKRWVPARVFDAGTMPAYSNYACSLAGYVVQRVSGEPFEDYVERHIFVPLDMKHSTFRQPLPRDLAPLMSTGYKLASGEPMKFEMVGPMPAGALASTAEDMAHFMIAHLQDGEYHGNRILQEATARQMHDSPLTLLPPLNRMELGFFEDNINGREVIGHLGDTDAFHTSLLLFLKENVGFYVSFNSAGKAAASHHLRIALFQDFADRYLPGPAVTTRVDAAASRQHARMLVGNWVASRGSFTTFLAAVGLVGQAKVSVGADGELVVPSLTGLNGRPIKWVETAPFVWQDVDSHERLAAKVENGEVTRWSIDMESPFMAFYRPTLMRNGAWLMPALYASIAALLLTVILWPLAAIVRRRFGTRLELPGGSLSAYRWSKLAALAILLALFAWVFTVTTMFSNLDKATSAMDGTLRIVQVFGALAFIGGFLLMLWNLRVVWTRPRHWPARVWSIMLALSAAVVLWVALAFHLIGWGVNY
jgi:CubicO group peptidase (beta-lactamase class C family)